MRIRRTTILRRLRDCARAHHRLGALLADGPPSLETLSGLLVGHIKDSQFDLRYLLPGRSGSKVLVLVQSNSNPLVIKFGYEGAIERERDAYNQLIRNTLPTELCPDLLPEVRSCDGFQSIAYTWAGGHGNIISLSGYLRSDNATPGTVKELFRLLSRHFFSWTHSGRSAELPRGTLHPNSTTEEVRSAILSTIDANPDEFSLDVATRLKHLVDGENIWEDLLVNMRSSSATRLHGDLNFRNVLIYREAHAIRPILIDFGSAYTVEPRNPECAAKDWAKLARDITFRVSFDLARSGREFEQLLEDLDAHLESNRDDYRISKGENVGSALRTLRDCYTSSIGYWSTIPEFEFMYYLLGWKLLFIVHSEFASYGEGSRKAVLRSIVRTYRYLDSIAKNPPAQYSTVVFVAETQDRGGTPPSLAEPRNLMSERKEDRGQLDRSVGLRALGGSEVDAATGDMPDLGEVGDAELESRMRRLADPCLTWQELCSRLTMLVPAEAPIMSPGSSAPLWDFVRHGKYVQLRTICEGLLEAEKRCPAVIKQDPVFRRQFSWIRTIHALCLSRTGFHSSSRTEAQALLRAATADPEATAWLHFVLAIVDGKLETKYFVRKKSLAVQVAERSGFYWLAAYIKLNSLSKQTWQASERGNPMSGTQFEEELGLSLQDLARYLSPDEATHLLASRHACKVFHSVSQRVSWDEADRLAREAQRLFAGLGDFAEVARMLSTKGGITLYTHEHADAALQELRAAAALRASTAEVSRLRYDLRWISEAQRRLGQHDDAFVSARLALDIHHRLYGNRPVDRGLAADLRRLVTTSTSTAQRVWTSLRRNPDKLAEAIEEATGINKTLASRFTDS